MRLVVLSTQMFGFYSSDTLIASTCPPPLPVSVDVSPDLWRARAPVPVLLLATAAAADRLADGAF